MRCSTCAVLAALAICATALPVTTTIIPDIIEDFPALVKRSVSVLDNGGVLPPVKPPAVANAAAISGDGIVEKRQGPDSVNGPDGETATDTPSDRPVEEPSSGVGEGGLGEPAEEPAEEPSSGVGEGGLGQN